MKVDASSIHLKTPQALLYYYIFVSSRAATNLRSPALYYYISVSSPAATISGFARLVPLHFCLFARRDDFGITRVVLLHFCFFARCDDFGISPVVLLHCCFFARCDDFGIARVVLLHCCFFARCDEFGVARVVGQAGSLRPIVNRPNLLTSSTPRSRLAAMRSKPSRAAAISRPEDAAQEVFSLWLDRERAKAPPRDTAKAQAAADRIRELRKGNHLPEGVTIRDMIEARRD
jgi:hypothetical protein